MPTEALTSVPERDSSIPLADTGFYTSRDNLAAEKSLLQSVRALQTLSSPLIFPAAWLARKRDAYYDAKKDRMDEAELNEQLTLVYDALTKDDRMTIITGPPGAAKTVVATLWVKLAREQAPHVPVVLITQEKPALHRIHEKLGFQEAQLLLLADSLHQDVALKRNAIVLIDEAGLLGTRTLAALLEKIAAADPAKIILIGDDKQLIPTEAGQPFRWLRERKKIPVSELSFPYRQKNPVLRHIVLDLYNRRIDDALSKITIDFVDHDVLLQKARDLIDMLQPDKSLTLVHGHDWLRERLKVVKPGYRIYTLAAAQGLAVDEAILFLGGPIDLSEFLVGCSRARHDLRIIVDKSVYADRAALAAAIRTYPIKRMALDVISEEKLLEIVDQT